MTSLAPIFVVMVVGTILFIVSQVNQQKQTRSQFFDRFNALGAAGDGTNRVFTVGAHQVRTDYFAGAKNSPSRLALVTSVGAPGSFTVAKEGSADRLFEGLGLEGKIATHDPDFDGRFHIVSDDEPFAGAYFASPRKREAAAALFGLGCARIELGEGGLKAVWTPFIIAGRTSVDFITQSLPHLAVLAEELPQGLPFVLPSGLSKKQFDAIFGAGLVILMVAFIALPILAQSLRYIPLDGWALFLDSAKFSGAAFAAFILAVLSAIKGKSWFFAGILQAFLLGAIFIPFAGYWGTLWFNCKMDAAQPQQHVALVQSKYTTSGKNATYYHARVVSWRPGHATEKLNVSWQTFNQLQPGRTIATVITKPGHLGHEWLVGYRFAQAPGNP